MVIYCAVSNCFSSNKDPKRSFFRFPLDLNRCKQWIKAIDYSTKGLTKNAVPTLKLPSSVNNNLEKCTQTDIVTNMKKTKETKTKVQLLKLIDYHKKLKTHSCKLGTEAIDLFALKVCVSKPHAYRVIRELLDLPAEKKLCKDYIDIETKLTSNAKTCLEMKIKNLNRSERYCVVYAEKIDVQCNLYYRINKDRIIGFHDINGTQTQQLATHAVVVVARGILSDWEQPLTHCFLSQGQHNKDINVWLSETLSQVMRMGLKVTAFISGHDKIFTDVAKMWGVTVGKPYFFVNKQKVYYLFEFHKLVKSLRDNLMENDYLFHDSEGNELIATWEDVKTVYSIDSQRQYPLAPELTESTTRADKVKIEFAPQVFSKPVAAAMTYSKELGQLEEKSAGTIKLIQMVDETIEVLKSSLDLTVPAAESAQIEVIKQFIHFLKDVTVLVRNTSTDITNTIKCLKGLKVTLKNIVDLSQDLRLKGFKTLHTCKIYENFLPNFIKGNNCKKPSPVKLDRAFKKYFVDSILKHSKNDNSSDALDGLLSMDLKSGVESFRGKVVRTLLVGSVDYRFNVPEKHSLVYVCGYLLKKCYKVHKCSNLQKYLHFQHISDQNTTPYYEAFLSLPSIIIPPDHFIDLVKEMDKVFTQYFQKKQIHSIGNEIKAEINQIILEICCPCFPTDYLVKLFIRFRIFNVISSNNNNFKDKSFKWKCFCIYNI